MSDNSSGSGFAFIAGLIPLLLATGPGAVGNLTIGASSLGGMLFGTVFGVVIVPGLYYIFASIVGDRKLIKDEDDKKYILLIMEQYKLKLKILQLSKVISISNYENSFKNLTKLSSLSYLNNNKIDEPSCNLNNLISNSQDLILLTGNYHNFFGKLFYANKIKDFETIKVAVVMTIVATSAKYIAAWVTQKSFKSLKGHFNVI